MKFQSSELPLGKPQTRRKSSAPKIAPLVAITILLTVVPIYYPSIRYSFSSSEDSIQPVDRLDDRSRINEPCPAEDVPTQPCNVPLGEEEKDNFTVGKNVEVETVGEEENEKPVNLLEKLEENIRIEISREKEKEKHVKLPENDEKDMKTETKREEEKEKPVRLPEKDEKDMKTETTREEEKEKPVKLPEKDEKNARTTNKKVSETRKRLEKHDQRARRKSGHRQRDFSIPKVMEKPEKKGDYKNLTSEVADNEYCDLFAGEWVENPEGPYYTNNTCNAIQQHQNCLQFERPDTGFLKWRWRPDDCELPIFDPFRFLEMVRGKSLAFVGDSVARNHMQSLICLLSRVVYPEDISETYDENRRWIYKDYDFNISMFWAPYLVRTEKTNPNDVTKPFKLYLDEFDEYWTKGIQNYDYAIISAGHWFFRPTMFYINRSLVGCLYCQESNITHHTTAYFSYRRAFRTAFRAINSQENFKGVAFLRTFAPSHFENAPWDKGGDCNRTKPFKRNEKALDDYNLEFYKIQLQELKIAQRAGRRRGLKFRLFDATQPMLLRPDGHPSKYGRWPNPNVTVPNDCVHWCLPGPIDAWNDFLVELLKREIGD